MPRSPRSKPEKAEPMPFHNLQNGPLLSEEVKNPPRRAPGALSEERSAILQNKVDQIVDAAEDE